MYVRLVKKSNDHVSIRIVESVRIGKKVRQKSLCCVGHTHKDNREKIEQFRRIGQRLIRDMKDELQMILSGTTKESYPPQKQKPKPQSEFPDGMVCAKSLKELSRICIGGSDIFGEVYEQLNFLECWTDGYKRGTSHDLFKEIVLSRLEHPCSKKKSIEKIKQRKDKDLDLDCVYRMMDKVYKQREEIKKRVCDKTLSLFKEEIDLVFFDVTTLYFESFVSDELRSS